MKKKISLFICFVLGTSVLPAQQRIINGTPVSPPAHPWMAGLSESTDLTDHFCGGVLISDEWVMTAAHCIENTQPQSVYAFFNAYYLSAPRSGYIIRQADSLLIHPGYDPNLEEHDIGLIHLRQPVSLQPVFLPQAGDEHLIAPGRMHTILGWGATDTFLSWGSDTLLKANVPIVDDSICNLPFAYDGEVTQNMICAGYMAGGTDACSGDSGGPLLTLEDNHWYATGIVSWGYGCASPNLPGVYTKVMNYIGWIKQHVDSIQQPPTGVQNIVQQSVRIYNDGNALLIWNEGEIHLRKIQLLTAGAALVEEQAASAEGKNLMSLQHLAQGVYVVKIITDEGIVTRKVLR